MLTFKYFLMNADAEATGGAGAPSGAPPATDIAGDPSASNGGTPPAAPDISSDWRSLLPEDMRDDPSIKDFKDLSALAKSYKEAQSFIGNSIRIPSEDASEEARKEFVEKLMKRVPDLMLKPTDDPERKKEVLRMLGMPEKPEEYEIPEVEGVNLPEERVDFLRKVAHEAGVTNEQFKTFMEKALAADAEVIAQQQQAQQQKMAELKQEWGHAFDERVATAKKMADVTGAPESLKQAIESGAVGPETYKWLFNLSKQLGEEAVNLADQAQEKGVMTPAEAEARINEIMNNREHPYWNAHHPEHQKAVEKMVELMKFRSPGASDNMNDLRAGFSS